MNPFSALNSPHDIRWQGTPSAHHKIFLIKTLFVVLAFIPLVIAEGVLFQKWWATTKFKNREDYSP